MPETNEPQPAPETEQSLQPRTRRPTGLELLWWPIRPSAENVITSALLDDGPTTDCVQLFVHGELAAKFEVPAGLGARLLAECGLERAR